MVYKKYQSELEQELRKLVSFKPVTNNKNATKKLLLYVEKELSVLGMKSVLEQHDGFWSLVAGTRSLESSEILLQAHIDVVPAIDEMFEVTSSEDCLYGRGVYDMLFSAASYLVVLRALAKQGILDAYDIGIMLTSDEEVGGHKGVGALIEKYSCSVCILPDAGKKDVLNSGSKGVLQLLVRVNGTSGHSARPNEYDNPIYKAARFISEIEEKFDNHNIDKTTCSITVINGGDAYNQVPDNVELIIDIRYVSSDSPEKIHRSIEVIANKNHADTEVIVLEPAFSIDKDNHFIKEYIKFHRKFTNRQMHFDSSNGSSDARFFTAKGIPVIMTRPEGGGLHGLSEWVSVEGLNEFTNILEQYITTVAGKNP